MNITIRFNHNDVNPGLDVFVGRRKHEEYITLNARAALETYLGDLVGRTFKVSTTMPKGDFHVRVPAKLFCAHGLRWAFGKALKPGDKLPSRLYVQVKDTK